MNLLIKFPPAISIPLFFLLTATAIATRFFLGNMIGIFLLSILLYWVLAASGVDVLTAEQLVLWLDDIEPEYKAALVTALVTVAGFIFAFHSATANWKNQLNAQLKAQLAGELEEFFGPLSSDINEASIYAKQLVETVNKIQNGASFAEATFSIRYLQDQQNGFLSARNRIVKASIEVHRLIGRSYNILSSGWGTVNQIRLAASRLSKISEVIWIQLPVVDLDDPDHIQVFLNHVNISECLQLINACEENSATMSGLVGGLRGYLLAPIVGFNLNTLLTLLGEGVPFRETVGEFHQALKDKK